MANVLRENWIIERRVAERMNGRKFSFIFHTGMLEKSGTKKGIFFRKSGKKWRYHFPVGFRGSQCLREGSRNRPSFVEKGILPFLQD